MTEVALHHCTEAAVINLTMSPPRNIFGVPLNVLHILVKLACYSFCVHFLQWCALNYLAFQPIATVGWDPKIYLKSLKCGPNLKSIIVTNHL